MEVVSPPVVPEAFPGKEYLLPRGRSQGEDVGETLKEAEVIGDNPWHLGLGKHHLCNQDPIRRVLSSPGKIPPVICKPLEKALEEFL